MCVEETQPTSATKKKRFGQNDEEKKLERTKNHVTPEGIEPPTFRSGVERAAIAPRSQHAAILLK